MVGELVQNVDLRFGTCNESNVKLTESKICYR
jgi:hypothetical protein